MEITINNQTKSINNCESISIRQLLNLEIPEEQKQKGIAVAINHKVIPKAAWDSTIISENSSILIIKATQGG